MSSLSARHKNMLEYLFEMQSGYLLNFSSRKLHGFMLDYTGIDINESPGYINEPSKAKKFRYFISHEPDSVVGKVILELLKIRKDEILLNNNGSGQCMDKYADFANEIERVAYAMCSGTVAPQNEAERLDATLLSAEAVLRDLISICENACNNRTYTYSRTENEINDYFRDMLCAKGYGQVLDQTRHGVSANGNDAGEVDILLKKDDREVAIIEGLKLDYLNRNYLSLHINKAIVNYNALGTPTFIIAYVGTTNFVELWNSAYSYLASFSYPLDVKDTIKEMVQLSAPIKCARLILSRDGYDFPVYFVMVNIGCNK